MNQYARPYGHATRAEYWWMWLFIQLLALIPLAVMFAAMLALPENLNVTDVPVWPIVVIIACGLLCGHPRRRR